MKEFDEINDCSYSCGCGNFGQHRLRTDKFIKGIYTLKKINGILNRLIH